MEKIHYKVWLTLEKVDPAQDTFETITEIDLGGIFCREENARSFLERLIEED